MMKIVKTKQDFKDSIKFLKRECKNITKTIASTTTFIPKTAFIPTMGALHDGHLSLIEHAKKNADIVIVSIFVNPTQFTENEDFGIYPRTEQEDCQILEDAGVNIVFIPEIDEIYNDGIIKDKIDLKYADILEGEFRKGFFYGVATVVNRLFDIVKPDRAFFGEKDYQQLQIIKQLAKIRQDNIEIYSVPIKRDTNGLALSSRNIYLSADEKKIAPFLYKSLYNANKMYNDGYDIRDIEKATKQYLLVKGFDNVDYISIRKLDLGRLGSNYKYDKTEIRILAAVYLGRTRLIDNI